MRKLLVVIVLLIAGVFVFYEWSSSEAKRLIRQGDLPEAHHNALKHAIASRTLYKGLDSLGVPKPEDKVVWLGDLNEKVESYLRLNDKDSSLEMMKDMFNNLAGITAARFELEKGRVCKEDTLIVLAKTGGLRPSADDIQLAESEKQKLRETRDIEPAKAWFSAQYYFIQGRVMKRLNNCARG